ncbi:MAG: hypothetical protein A3J75_04585 [Acidobacteria bacterium RBG_16_68_9]|nr:MAG: hypothetical protein A3J75_04585 [Acidobacteria bacterium RBG_16_68_9]
MIRINLLTVERKKEGRHWGALSATQKLTIGCSAILGATAIAVLWWFWHLQQVDRQLDADVAAAQQESLRLREVLVQVQRFETQRTQLQQRVALIEELRKGQTGPVHMLDQISRSLPDRLWLTTMAQGKDVTMSIDGLTTSMTALSDFVANLEGAGYFLKPVEIVSSQVQSVSGTELVRFTVRAQFAMPGSAPAPSPQAGAPAPSAKPPGTPPAGAPK